MSERMHEGWAPSELARLGARLGTYRIVEVLGRGGMGIVYRAETASGEDVALKLMLPDLVISEDFRERFVREAEIGPRLRHPHIVETLDAGEQDGELFIAMRLIRGPNLKTLLKQRGRLSKSLTVAILRQAADALDFAHQSGVIHLDVKPQNILLEGPTEQNEGLATYLTDFGLLRPNASEQTTTRTGQIYGSIAYISPEQIENLHVDGRADVYSLACVAYESLTGEVPFDRPNEVAVLWSHVHEDPPRVTSSRHDLPRSVDGVLFTALAKRPDDRFLTCGDLVAELESATARKRSPMYPIVRPLVTRTPRQKQPSEVWSPNFFPELARVRAASQRTNWGAIGVVGALLLGLLAIQLTWEGGIPRAVSDTAETVAELVPPVVDVTSRDENKRARAARSRSVGGAALPRVPRPQQIQSVEVTRPHANGRPDLVAVRGGGSTENSPATVTETASSSLLSFTRDTDATPNGRSDHVLIMNADGSNVRMLRDEKGASATSTTSPDGQQIAYESDRERSLDIYVMDIDGAATPKRITPHDGLLYGFPHWSPDGKKIVMVATDSWSKSEYPIIVVHVASGRIRHLASGFDPSWSPDGRKVAFTNGTGDIFVIGADGTGLTQVTQTSVREWRPSWSPDGRSLVFDAADGTLSSDLYTIDLGTGERRRLTSTPGRLEFRPCWLPDGSGIAVDALDVASGNEDIWLVSADGRDATNLTRSVTDEYYVDCGW